MKKRTGLMMFILWGIGATAVRADGNHEIMQQTSTPWSTYLLLFFVLVFLVGLIGQFILKNRADSIGNAKKTEEREVKKRMNAKLRYLKAAWMVSLAGAVIVGGYHLLDAQNRDREITMEHIHGLGYSPEGDRILFASHTGIIVYHDGGWMNGAGDHNDYMGFSTFDQGFYSSGHPGSDSSMIDPFGIVKSMDGGKTLEKLALYGKIDFHLLTASYKTHTLYVYNPQSNEKMKTVGLYLSKDEGKTWTKSDMTGFSGEPSTLAVHPDNDAIVALGTAKDLFLSRDYGKTFERSASGKQIISLSFSPKGLLYVGSYVQQPALTEMNLNTKEIREIKLPPMKEDAPAYLAVNPKNDNEIVFASINRDTYLSKDKGESWEAIAKAGKGLQHKQ